MRWLHQNLCVATAWRAGEALQQAREGALFRRKQTSPQHEQAPIDFAPPFTAATRNIHTTPPRLLQLVPTVTDNKLPVTASPYYWLQRSLHQLAVAALRVARIHS